MIIHIEDLKFRCIIGILDFERASPQDIIVNLKVEYIYEKNFINYADIVEIIKETMIKNEFLLIEDAINSLNLKLVKEFSSIKSIDLKVTKPSILSDCKVSVSDFQKF